MQRGGSTMDVICVVDGPETVRLRAALLRSALALVDDPAEARVLVARVLQAAGEAELASTPLGQAELFRLLRQAYHSIERSRPRRRMRDSTVTSLAVQQAPARTGQGG